MPTGKILPTAKKRVLVVDDDPELVASVRAALLLRGYDVSVAGDGAEALAQIECTRPDLMLLDLVMPRRSGINVLDRMVRGTIRATPVIMMTADDEVKHRECAALRGVSVFLSKPFPIEELLAEVDTMLKA
jgi:two-component system, OmpR family, response regulator MprA